MKPLTDYDKQAIEEWIAKFIHSNISLGVTYNIIDNVVTITITKRDD